MISLLSPDQPIRVSGTHPLATYSRDTTWGRFCALHPKSEERNQIEDALRACRHSSLVQSSFIIRRSFSGALRTIELPPEQARREFIENISHSDFVLAPKGDGNYSNRFLEALSMGRIPVLIDTDVVLPFENTIQYENIVVRVPMNRVHETPQYIREFYDALDEEAWRARQKLARETYEHYLAPDSFFTHFFEQLLGNSQNTAV